MVITWLLHVITCSNLSFHYGVVMFCGYLLAYHFTMVLSDFFCYRNGYRNGVSSTFCFPRNTPTLDATGDAAGRQLLQWLEEQEPKPPKRELCNWSAVATRPHRNFMKFLQRFFVAGDLYLTYLVYIYIYCTCVCVCVMCVMCVCVWFLLPHWLYRGFWPLRSGNMICALLEERPKSWNYSL